MTHVEKLSERTISMAGVTTVVERGNYGAIAGRQPAGWDVPVGTHIGGEGALARAIDQAPSLE